MRRICVLFVVVTLISGACSPSRSPEVLQEELMETDRAFSRLSEEKGQAAAFLEYMAADGVLYPFEGEPVWSRDAYQALSDAAGTPAPGSSLTWEPLLADVSRSGDLGYTLGKYTASSTRTDGSKSERQGYYTTIWKRQVDGNWRFVFDGGNQLPADPEDRKE